MSVKKKKKIKNRKNSVKIHIFLNKLNEVNCISITVIISANGPP